MVRITRMVMNGFKSFGRKTEIVFGERFNCVLGPNGSGKSNILDSLCFVLGKSGAKGLRAEKSSNLIYNGGKSRKPAKQGEVSIWFSNENNIFGVGGDEVKITRIIKPSGQGVYKINDKTVTRQQVLELLSRARINPDGYNIVLQGDIVRLVEMSSLERRRIVEEIAGINVYEEKKEKALRELNRVEERINEADIILAERRAYLDELRADRDQALRFKELDEKIKRNKVTLLLADKRDREAKVSQLEKRIADAESKKDKILSEIDSLRKLIADKRQEIERINREVEEKGEKEQVAVHKQVEELKVKLALDKQRLTIISQELDKLKARKQELLKNNKELLDRIKLIDKSQSEIKREIASKEKELSLVDKRIADFKKKHNVEGVNDLDVRIQEIDKEADVLSEQIASLREQQQEVLREKDRLEVRLQGLDEKIDKVLSLEKEHKEQLQELKVKKQNFKEATLQLSKALSEDSSLAAQLANARDKLISRQEELSRLKAQAARVRESIAGGRAINAVLDLKKPGVYGTVSELGSAKKDYAVALEVAAGSRIRSVVVDSDAIAADLISFLKKNKLGVVTFLPLNKLKPPVIDPSLEKIKGKGVHGPAVSLVDFDPKFRKVFEYVFGNTLVVDDVATARRIGVGKVRMVTLSGDLIESSGAMQGGFRQHTQGLGFQERELKAGLDKLEREIADIEALIARLSADKAANEASIQRLRELKASLEGEIIKLEKSLHLNDDDLSATKDEKKKLKSEIKSLESEYDKLVSEISEKNRLLAKLKIEKQQLREKINSLRNPSLLAELNSFEEKKRELRQEIDALTLKLKTSESEKSNVLGPEVENVQKILKQHDKEESSFKAEQVEINARIKSTEKELKAKEAAEKAFYEQFKSLFNKRSKLTEEANNAENKILQLNDKVRQQEVVINTASLELARIKAEIAGLDEELKSFEGVEPYSNKSREVIKKEIAEFERLVADLGSVNLRALEIYDSVSAEFERLMEKKEKLVKERENVLVMINEVETKKKELFLKTYDIVNENFKRLFKMLSTKGEATLELENPKEVFEGGLTLKVRITGKKFLDIRSLSGGEKTLTALAFLFAVQEHEPAPFYVLDEVDAALDKKNSERLAKLVQEYSKNAQYIMISHNDNVITMADNLYGVSMDEHGVSKITSLKL